MIKTIPVIYRSGVFVPLKAVDEIAEETSLEIEVHLPIQEDELRVAVDDSFAQALALLHQTSGLLHSDLPDEEVRYLVESSELAEENLWLEREQPQ